MERGVSWCDFYLNATSFPPSSNSGDQRHWRYDWNVISVTPTFPLRRPCLNGGLLTWEEIFLEAGRVVSSSKRAELVGLIALRRQRLRVRVAITERIPTRLSSSSLPCNGRGRGIDSLHLRSHNHHNQKKNSCWSSVNKRWQSWLLKPQDNFLQVNETYSPYLSSTSLPYLQRHILTYGNSNVTCLSLAVSKGDMFPDLSSSTVTLQHNFPVDP